MYTQILFYKSWKKVGTFYLMAMEKEGGRPCRGRIWIRNAIRRDGCEWWWTRHDEAGRDRRVVGKIG